MHANINGEETGPISPLLAATTAYTYGFIFSKVVKNGKLVLSITEYDQLRRDPSSACLLPSYYNRGILASDLEMC